MERLVPENMVNNLNIKCIAMISRVLTYMNNLKIKYKKMISRVLTYMNNLKIKYRAMISRVLTYMVCGADRLAKLLVLLTHR
jgi:hypothetical protein